MALDHFNNSLVSLFEASADAQSNLFELSFSGDVLGTDASVLQRLTVRTDNFTAPETSQKSYKVKFANISIDRPASQVEVNRQFSFDFRVDANYALYRTLLHQQSLIFNADKSRSAYDIKAFADASLLFTTTVSVLTDSTMNVANSTEDSTRNLFVFENCWISEIAPLSFVRDSSEPHTIRVTVNFIDMKDYFEV